MAMRLDGAHQNIVTHPSSWIAVSGLLLGWLILLLTVPAAGLWWWRLFDTGALSKMVQEGGGLAMGFVLLLAALQLSLWPLYGHLLFRACYSGSSRKAWAVTLRLFPMIPAVGLWYVTPVLGAPILFLVLLLGSYTAVMERRSRSRPL